MSNLLPYIPFVLGGIFTAGYQINRIDTLFSITNAQGVEQKETREVIYDIHGKVCSIESLLKKK